MRRSERLKRPIPIIIPKFPLFRYVTGLTSGILFLMFLIHPPLITQPLMQTNRLSSTFLSSLVPKKEKSAPQPQKVVIIKQSNPQQQVLAAVTGIPAPAQNISLLPLSNTNLLHNSSFEQQLNGQPRDWNYQLESTTGNTFISKEGNRSGTFGLKFVGGGTGNFGISQPNVKTIPQRVYTLSLYVKTTNVGNSSIRFGFWNEYLNQRGAMKTVALSGTKDWTRYSFTTTTPGLITDPKNEFPMIEILGVTKGAVYIDDAQLTEGSVETSYNTAQAYNSSYAVGDGSIIFSTSGDIYPSYDDSGQLGSSTNQFKALNLSHANIDSDGNFSFDGGGTIKGNLTVNGSATISGSLNFGSAASAITFTGQIGSSLIPSANNTYDLGSSTNYWRNLYATTMNISGGQTIGGDQTITGNLSVNGTSTLTGAAALDSTLTVAGATTLNGNTTLGSDSSDMITANGLFNASLIPSSTAVNLGSSANNFGTLYVQNIVAPASGGTSGYWQLNSGALAPANITNDILAGGTATSSAKFQVFSNSGNATTSGNLTFNSAGTIQSTKNQTLTIGGDTTGNIILSPLNGSGNVGIGTTNPTATLNLLGRSIFQSSSNSTTAFQFLNSSGTTVLGMDTSNSNVGIGKNAATDIKLDVTTGSFTTLRLNQNGSNDLMHLQNNSTTVSKFTNTGALGINTGSSTLLAALDARGISGIVPVASISGATSFAGLVVDNRGTGDLFTASSSGLNRFVITQNGNVGIGTTAPVENLTVIGNTKTQGYFTSSSSSNSIRAAVYLENTSTGASAGVAIPIKLADTSASLSTINGISWQKEQSWTSTASTKDAYLQFNTFLDNAENAVMRLTSGGNVGIGTISPLAALDIRSNTGTAPTASISGATSFAGLVVDNSGVGDLFTASSSGLNRFVIKQNGNIGVGTTTPTGKLHILPGASTFALTYGTYSSGEGGLTVTANGNDSPAVVFNQNHSSAGGAPLALHRGATTLPYLTTTGTNENLIIQPNGVGTTVLNSTGGSVGISTTSVGNGKLVVNQPNSSGDIFAASTSGSTKFVINNSGNVGIGTNTPGGLLTLSGISNDTALLGANVGNASNALINLAPSSDGLVRWGLRIDTSNGNNSSNNLNFDYRQAGTGNPLTALTIQRTDGSIGINTTSPLAALDVRGNTGTVPVASISGQSSFAALAVDNRGTGDLFTASSSGLNRFVITQNGNVGIGTNTPASQLDVKSITTNNDVQRWMASDGSRLGRFTETSGGHGWFEVDNSAGTALFLLRADGGASYLNSGNVGIGTTTPSLKLDVQDSQSATAAAQIFNTGTGTDADGLVLKLGNTSTTAVASTNHFINFETSGIGIVGSIQGNGDKTINYKTNGIADFAEYMPKQETEEIPWGSLVCLKETGTVTSCINSSDKITGIASQFPTFTGGIDKGNKSITVGLTGLVRTRVSTQNGMITAGDMITSSSLAGVGVKATHVGMVAGRALESYTEDGTGMILVSIHPIWYDPTTHFALNETGDLSVNGEIMGAKNQAMTEFISPPRNRQLTESSSLSATIAHLQEQISSISAQFADLQKDRLLSQTIQDISTQSADLANNLSAETLSVSGKTVLADIGITGKLSMGLLTIEGMESENGTSSATINTLSGPLKLQSLALNGIDLMNGKVTIDTNGDITTQGTIRAKTIHADKVEIHDTGDHASTGEAIIPAGKTSVEVFTSALTDKSKIFATPDTYPVAVSKKKVKKDTFELRIEKTLPQPLKIDWWVVN